MGDFERLASEAEESGSDFGVLFQQAHDRLVKEHPDGFDVRAVGAAAWSRLPIGERHDALRSLFYAYWVVDQMEQESSKLTALARELGGFESEPLVKVHDALSFGLDDDGRVRVDGVALQAVASEVEVLRRRAELLDGGA